MEFEAGKIYEFYLRVDYANSSDSSINLTVTLSDKTTANIKVTKEQYELIQLGKVYYVKIECKFNGTRNQLIVLECNDIFKMELSIKLEEALRAFYDCADTPLVDLQQRIENNIASIKNATIRDIVLGIYKTKKIDFYTYPAAVKMHHAYVGGLAYHTTSMLDLCDSYLKVYPQLNRDLLVGGVILHDMCKINEFTQPVEAAYSIEGQLLGHLVMGSIEIDRCAVELGLQKKEEFLILKHILISHHGQQSFGSPKKPMIPEALLLWFLDSIDSKLRVVNEVLEGVDEGSFSEGIPVCDRTRFYKTKI